MAGHTWQSRASLLAFVCVSLYAMSFAQAGFWSIGIIDGKPVYLILLLAPLVMGSLLFSPLMGGFLGLFAAVIGYAHAVYSPLDYYEVYFMTPLNTFATMPIVGVLSGLLFSAAIKNSTTETTRLVKISGACILISFIASALVAFNNAIIYGNPADFSYVQLFLFSSPLGSIVQALLDAAFLIVLCLLAEHIAQTAMVPMQNRKLLSVFRNWMAIISLIVFAFTSATIFSLVTMQAQIAAEKDIMTEISYLEKQLERRDDPSDIDNLLEGYEANLDGTVFVTDKHGTVLVTDNPGLIDKGQSITKVFSKPRSQEDATPDELVEEYFECALDYPGEIAAIQTLNKDGVLTMDIWFLGVGAFDQGYIAILRPPSQIYANRSNVMAASTILAVILIAAIGVMATLLLNRVVVRRIDETNDSLEKITDGDLNERVRVRDSREFSSLSTGINTTVSALRDSIAEAEQKNAQELATAKAIQESALPRDFPPFPDNDRFDIYASMKTAREVGGDFYDFFLFDENKLGFIIADVSGKGIPAALFMMTAKTQIRNYMESGLPIAEAVGAANHQLCLGNDASMFVTMFAGMLNYETGDLQYVNAGHNPPLICHFGTWEWMRKRSGVPLGLYDGFSYKQLSRTLDTGDLMYLYTDGVTEAMNADEKLFGDERLEQTLEIYQNMNPRSVGVGIRRAITDFTLDAEQNDDITMLILKYGVPPEKRAVMILPAKDNQLVHVHNFIHEELHRRNAPNWVENPLDIAAEELFVNVCHYAYPNATEDDPGEVRISFVYDANPPSLTVSIEDDGIPYDPLAKPDAITPKDIKDVPIGGLGILMAKRSVDEMSYERVGNSNVVTFRKGW